MKLSQLATAHNINDVAIHTLLGYLPTASRRHDTNSMHYHFIDSVIRSGVLSENAASGLENVLKAGVARLRAALMPRSSKDLDALLAFVAPDGGGSKAIEELIDTAKSSNTPLIDNIDWWESLFATVNIYDTKVQDDIKEQVAAASGQRYQRANSQTASNSRNKVRSALGHDSYADSLRKEREASGQYESQLTSLVDKSRQSREAGMNRIGELNKKLDSLMSRSRTENVYTDAVNMLLEQQCVKINLQSIANSMLSKVYHQAPVITEAGLMDKMRTFAANPGYASHQVNRYTNSNDNGRHAQLAIQLATEHLRKSFQTTLAQSGISPDEVLKLYNTWRQLRTSGGNPQQMQGIQSKLQKIYALFTGETPTVDTSSGNASYTAPQQSTPPTAAGPANPATAMAVPQQPQQAQSTGIAPVPPPQPEDDRLPRARELAKKLMIAAAAAQEAGQDPLQAAMGVARRAAKSDPVMAKIIWKLFLKKYRGG